MAEMIRRPKVQIEITRLEFDTIVLGLVKLLPDLQLQVAGDGEEVNTQKLIFDLIRQVNRS